MSQFASPVTSSDSPRPADLHGHLLIINPIEYKTGITTSLGEADAIECDLTDLTTGTEHNSVLFFNIALKNSLKPNIGKTVLARMGQGVAKPGKSAPWILEAVNDAEGIEEATTYLAKKAGGSTAVAAPSGVSPEIQALLNQLTAKPV